uniref:GIY-YIG endonuclease n=1 Tax=Scytalidium sp. TaxID=1715249 RepID=A0A513U0T6_9PEZI|nr:GIY-YIG endonuclease [Scytalidium sp.]
MIKSIITYSNCELEKNRILKENKNKAVVYRWTNNVNQKTYIGSSVNFSVRLYKYYSVKHLMKHNTAIHNALLKYGHSNFTLDIIEYCEGVDPIIREQYYLDLLRPEYNILEQAGSSLGFKHSEETLEFFKNNRKVSEETRKNLSLAATGRILTEEDKKKISSSRQGIKLSDETRAKISAAAISLKGVPVIIKNIITLEVIEYTSLTEVAKAIGVSRTAVKKAIISEKPIKKIYCCIASHKK